MHLLTKSIITLAAIATTGLHAETFPVLKDTFGSTATSTIGKAAGKSPLLKVNAKNAAFLDFSVKSAGFTASQVSGARITIFFPKVTTAGNLSLSLTTSVFQEVFPAASIPIPTNGTEFAQVPITTALTKNFVTVDVTDEIKQILDSPTEFGFTIKSDGTANCTIGAKEGSATGYPAVLEVDIAGGDAVTFTDVNTQSATVTGALTGTSGSFSGNLGLGSATLTGTLNGAAANFTGALAGTNGSFSGNLGVGTASPTAKLHVDGTLRVTGATTFLDNISLTNNKSLTISGTGSSIGVGGNIDATNITASQTLSSFNGDVVATNGNVVALATSGLILAPGANGKIGIGTSTPARSMSIESADNAFIGVSDTSGAGSAGVFTTASNRTYFFGNRRNSQNFTIFDGTVNLPRLNITPAGAVGIGIEAPAGMLHVNGAVFCAILTETSDARFKKEIEPIAFGLDTVRKLRPVSYDWRRDEFPERKFDEGRQLGFIAQEVRDVLPHVVAQAGEYYQIHYTAIVPVLTRAIQELAATKDQEIAALQETNAELAEKLAASEARRAALDEEIQARLARLEAAAGTPIQRVLATATK